MRSWLLSNTTYGSWLPGDPHGSVSSVRDLRPGDEATPFRFEHDIPGEPWEEAIPGLQRSALEQMKGPPICLDFEKAEAVLAQFQETAGFRTWTLRAVAIMVNHFPLFFHPLEYPNPTKNLPNFIA